MVTKDKTSTDERYMVSPEGVICDAKTGHEWLMGPDEDTRYGQAEKWAKELSLNGGGWRLPTLEELDGVCEKDKKDCNGFYSLYPIHPVFKTSGWYAWAWEEKKNSLSVNYSFPFQGGTGFWFSYGYSRHARGLAIRPKSKDDVSI